MNKVVLLSLLLFFFCASANEALVCPEGAKIISDSREYKGKDTKVISCVNDKDKLHGTSIIIVNGVIVDKCAYENGIENGVCTSWYVTGEKKKIIHYKKGKPDGEIKGWHQNGEVELQAFYENGKPTGVWKYWNENGELLNAVKH